MLTLGPYAQLGLIVAGLWLFVISAAVACIVAGAIGSWISRRSGRKCPACDYQGNRVDVVVHHALDHERGALTMPVGVMCAICGGTPSRRIDLTESEVNPRDISDYEIRGVLRGTLICDECVRRRGIASLLNLRGGVQLVRGCMVQCADRPPRRLRWVLPGGARMWTKTVCPCCHGRATVQIIADVVERPESALWRGLKDAFGLLSLRRQAGDYELEEAEDTPAVVAIESGGEPEETGYVIGHNPAGDRQRGTAAIGDSAE